MEHAKVQGFKTFLTERFTASAVEVFGEVESMMEACYEENKRLRSMSHMVSSPELKLPRIDADSYERTTIITGKPSLESNIRPVLETPERLSKTPKEEMVEYEIDWDTEQQHCPGQVENFNVQVSVKEDPEDEVEETATNASREVAIKQQGSSDTVSTCDSGSTQESWSPTEADDAAHASFQVSNEDATSNSQQANTATANTNPCVKSKKRKIGAAIYNSKFNPKWEEDWPCITAGSTPYHFWCTVCRRESECKHSGRADVVRHFKRDYHKKKLKFYEKLLGSSLKSNMTVIPETGEMDTLEAQTRRAEVKVAVALVQHDIPLVFSDHLSPLFKQCFPDSKIASKYSSARTKTTAIINKCVAPYLMTEMARNLSKQPFSSAVEGCNKIGKEKMKPLTVRLWSKNGVVKNFLNMGVTTRADASIADSICRKINEALQSYFIPWTNCIALSVDDTKVDLESEKSGKTNLLDQNPALYVLGWPCDIVHDNARVAGLTYYQESGFDVEDMCADLGFWFRSSTNHPDDFRLFCDTHYMEILQNSTTKWLSLSFAVNHVLRLYKHLKVYFKSTDKKSSRGVRLRARFEDPMTEVHLLFYQALLPVFGELNQIFQRQDSCVHLLHGQIRNFICMLMLKFLKPETFKETSPEKVSYQDEENQLPDCELDSGLTTKAASKRSSEAGVIKHKDISAFHKAARGFLQKATEFAVKKLPVNDPLLSHAVFVDFKKRRDCQSDDVLYFVQRYNHLLPYTNPKEQDVLRDEFLDYQAMEECDIPSEVWKDALVKQSDDGVPCNEHHRMDVVWAFLSDVRNGVTGTSRFPRLMKKSTFSLQKTMSQMPRMMINKSFTLSRADQESFLQRLSEAFRDFPDDEKPSITTLDLKSDDEWTECAFGQVPKGSPLSYQFPSPSSKDFKPCDDVPPQPMLPLSSHESEPVSVFPTLSAQEQTFLKSMNVTWEEAHSSEQDTRGSREAAEKLLKMRLTSRFKDICNLKPGRSHADHLLYKIQKGNPRCKTAQIDVETKPEALREYCRNLCVNWSPCGLVVHPNAPWVGAIPDGLVYDPKETSSFGSVHIQFVYVKSFIECQFSTCKDGVLLLKRTHRHYWHIQGEMMVTGTSWCDSVSYSREDMSVQRIYRDEAIIKLIKKKMDEFFFYYYSPNSI